MAVAVLYKPMGFIGLILGLVVLVLVGAGLGVGIVAGLFACVAAAVLGGLGVVSSSVALGFLTRRPATAIRALLLQCGVLAGIPAGAATAWAGHGILTGIAAWQGWPAAGWEWKVPLFGAVGGAFAGVSLALTLDFILRRGKALVEARVKRHLLARQAPAVNRAKSARPAQS